MSTPNPATTPWVPLWNLNGVAAGSDLTYEGDYVPATAYTDGDVVVYQGVAYMCVRPTSAAPAPWPQSVFTTPYYGTTLPANAVDGQEAILVDSLTAPTYRFRFRFNAQSSSPYKWEYVGGTDFWQRVNTNEGTATAGAWLDLATLGPRFVLPRSGDWDVIGSASGSHTASLGTLWIAPWNGTATSGAGVMLTTPVANQPFPHQTFTERFAALAAGTDIRMRYYNSVGGSAAWQFRWISVRPVRVA
jgi:hypothetical protein